MAISGLIPKREHASGMRRMEPPATPETPHAASDATVSSAMIVFDVKESKNKENKNEKIVKKPNDEKLVSKTEQEQENLRNKN